MTTVLKKQVIQRSPVTHKKLVNEDIFGKNTFEESSPEKGISHLKIKAHEAGNIPGLIKHWEMDIKNRKEMILSWKNQSKLQRGLNVIQKKMIPPEVSGMEMAKLHPTKIAMDKVKSLKQDPTDTTSRLELVSIVARSGRQLSLEDSRILLLQATVACCFGELNNIGLKSVLWIQDSYFTKLFHKCKQEVQNFDDKSKSKVDEKENAYTHQESKIKERALAIHQSMKIIKSYQNQAAKALKDAKKTHPISLTLHELTAFILGEGNEQKGKSNNEKKISIFTNAAELISLIRALPLLKEQGAELTEYLKKIDSDDPLTHFLHAKINMGELMSKVSQYQGGRRTKSIHQEILESFKDTYRQYGLAVKKVGKMPKTKTELSILIEYANLVHYFYKASRTTLGLNLPQEWLRTALSKAHSTLRLIQDVAPVEALMQDLQRDMAGEGILV